MMSVDGIATGMKSQVKVICSVNYISEHAFPENNLERIAYLEKQIADCQHAIQSVRGEIAPEKVHMVPPDHWVCMVYEHEGDLFLLVECAMQGHYFHYVKVPFSEFPERLSRFEALKPIVIEAMQREFGDRLVPYVE